MIRVYEFDELERMKSTGMTKILNSLVLKDASDILSFKALHLLAEDCAVLDRVKYTCDQCDNEVENEFEFEVKAIDYDDADTHLVEIHPETKCIHCDCEFNEC